MILEDTTAVLLFFDSVEHIDCLTPLVTSDHAARSRLRYPVDLRKDRCISSCADILSLYDSMLLKC